MKSDQLFSSNGWSLICPSNDAQERKCVGEQYAVEKLILPDTLQVSETYSIEEALCESQLSYFLFRNCKSKLMQFST